MPVTIQEPSSACVFFTTFFQRNYCKHKISKPAIKVGVWFTEHYLCFTYNIILVAGLVGSSYSPELRRNEGRKKALAEERVSLGTSLSKADRIIFVGEGGQVRTYTCAQYSNKFASLSNHTVQELSFSAK